MTKQRNQELTKGDYVLATQFADGRPGDQWRVGFYSHSDVSGKYVMVKKDSAATPMTSFLRAEKITEERGEWLIRHAEKIQLNGRSLWWFVRYPMQRNFEDQKQRKVPSGYRIDADKKKWLQENGGITPLIDRALGEAGLFKEQSAIVHRQMIESKEALILAAITHAMGNDDWDKTEAYGRCGMFTQPNGHDIFSFDDEPMIRFYPFESRVETIGLRTMMAFSQNYRLLYEPVDIGDIKP